MKIYCKLADIGYFQIFKDNKKRTSIKKFFFIRILLIKR